MDKLKSSFFWFCLTVVGIIFFLPPVDTDLGWHLRYGEFFFKTLTVPRTNFLTYFLPNYYWHNSYLGYQILVYFVYRHFSLIGLSILYSTLLVSIYLLFNSLNPKLAKFNLLFFLLSSYLSWHVLYAGIRAQVFSLFFYFLELLLLKYSDKHTKCLCYLPLLMIFWVNIHGSFVFGLTTFVLFTLIKPTLEKQKNYIFLISIIILMFLGTLINPYGIGVYEEGIRHFLVPMNTLIAEWVGLNQKLIIYLILLCVTSFFVFFKRYKKSNKLLFFLSFVFLMLSLKARRNVPFYVFTMSLYLLDTFSEKLLKLQEKPLVNTLLILIPLGVLSINLFSSSIGRTIKLSTSREDYCTKGMVPYPCRAIDYFREKGLKGRNVFSSYEWGGFLEWQMPEYLYFVDGRTPAWKTPDNISPYISYLNLIQAKPGYNEFFKNLRVDYLLIGANTFLDIDLTSNVKSPWVEIFRDSISVIYRKKG